MNNRRTVYKIIFSGLHSIDIFWDKYNELWVDDQGFGAGNEGTDFFESLESVVCYLVARIKEFEEQINKDN